MGHMYQAHTYLIPDQEWYCVILESSKEIAEPSYAPVSPLINESIFQEPGLRHYYF